MVKLTSYCNEVQADIAKAERGALKNAARFVEGKIKEKIDSLGIKKHSGNLKKGVASNAGQHNAFVGFGPPAYHAHLLEFGTKIRQTKTGKVKGQIKPTPILSAVMSEQAEAVADILADRWLA